MLLVRPTKSGSCDSDVVVVPKRAILVVDDVINLIFTRGLYGVVPFNFTLFQGLSTGASPVNNGAGL